MHNACRHVREYPVSLIVEGTHHFVVEKDVASRWKSWNRKRRPYVVSRLVQCRLYNMMPLLALPHIT